MSGFLVVLHTPTNTGYAIAPLERVFLRVARNLVEQDRDIHFAYKSLSPGPPETLPHDFANVLALDLHDRSAAAGARAREYVREHAIDTVLAFDAGLNLAIYRPLRGRPLSSLSASTLSGSAHAPAAAPLTPSSGYRRTAVSWCTYTMSSVEMAACGLPQPPGDWDA